MQFRDVEYYQAGIERMKQARTLLEQEHSYALAMYCGGLAVECMLRAFRWKHDKSFEGRHNLQELLKASGILQLDADFAGKRIRNGRQDGSSIEFSASMNQVILLWTNSLRFASEASAKAYLVKIGRVQGIKGDPLKKNASDLIDAAQRVIDRGIQLWRLHKK